MLPVNSDPDTTQRARFVLSFLAVVAVFGALLSVFPLANAQNSPVQGRVGDTELHWAAYRGHADVVARLLRSGARVDQRVDRGSSPLHLAAYKGHNEVVSVLIESGADVNARTDEGITPLDWARSNEHAETEAMLLAHGAKVGKPLAIKSRSKRVGSAASPGGSPGQFLLSNSGEYLNTSRTKRQLEPIIEEEVIERPIRQEELDKLESVAQINHTMERYRNAQAWDTTDTVDSETAEAESSDIGVNTPSQGQPSAQEPPAEEIAVKNATSKEKAEALVSSQAFRVQLAAVGDGDRAQVLRAQYSQRYRSIFGDAQLVVEPVVAGGRKLFRLRSSGLSQSNAEAICLELGRSEQDCIIVKPVGF